MEPNESPQPPQKNDGSHTTFKAFGFEFSGPTWLAIVFFVCVIILALTFGNKISSIAGPANAPSQPTVTTLTLPIANNPDKNTESTKPALAGDQEDAQKAAKGILTSLQQKKYETLWNNQTSEFFKSRTTKNSFLANLTMGRQTLGAAGESKFVDMAYAQTDPTTGYKGEIYAFNYLNTYAVGKFYERIVVVKEKDGIFRLSGLGGSPAQK